MENLETGDENCAFKAPYAKLIQKSTFEHFYLKENVEIIGRSFASLVTLRDLDVSRTHCLLSKESEDICALLPQGLSDTLVNGEICPRNTKIILKNGDEIGISRHHFTFKYMPDGRMELPLQNPMEITYITDDDTIEIRSSLFELAQNEEREELNQLHIHLRSGRDEIVCDLRAQEIEQLLNNNGNSEEEKDVFIKELKTKLEKFQKKEKEWLKYKEEMEKCLDEQKKEFEEQLKSKKSQEKALTERKRNNKHLQAEYGLTQNSIIELQKENNEFMEELDIKKKKLFNMTGSVECGICSEVYMEPVLLNCGHTFCKSCITTWKETKKECPICRTEVQKELRNFFYDDVIDKYVLCLPEEEQKERENLVINRLGVSSRASSSERASVEEAMQFYTNMLGTSIRPQSTSSIRNPLYWFEPGTANLIRGEQPHQGTSAGNSSPALTHVNTSLSTVVSTSVIDLTTGFLD